MFTRLLRAGIYTAVYALVAPYPDEAFWTSWHGWLLALGFFGVRAQIFSAKG